MKLDDKSKIKLADHLLDYMDKLSEDDDPLYEEDELFEESKKPIVKISVKKKGK